MAEKRTPFRTAIESEAKRGLHTQADFDALTADLKRLRSTLTEVREWAEELAVDDYPADEWDVSGQAFQAAGREVLSILNREAE